MKNKACIVVFLLLFRITHIYAASRGDVNGDEAIDIVDALLIAQDYVSLDPANFDSTVADVNGDTMIDIVDAFLVARYYVEFIDTLDGCESPEPGSQMLPPNGATNTSADITLGIIFEGTPKLNGSGRLQLRDSSGSIVETFASSEAVSRVVAGKTYKVNPIQIINNAIYDSTAKTIF